MKVVEVRNLTKKFDQVIAVDDASFEVDKGQITSLLGPSPQPDRKRSRKSKGPPEAAGSSQDPTQRAELSAGAPAFRRATLSGASLWP